MAQTDSSAWRPWAAFRSTGVSVPRGPVHESVNLTALVLGVIAFHRLVPDGGAALPEGSLEAFVAGYLLGSVWVNPDLDLAERRNKPHPARLWGWFRLLWVPLRPALSPPRFVAHLGDWPYHAYPLYNADPRGGSLRSLSPSRDGVGPRAAGHDEMAPLPRRDRRACGILRFAVAPSGPGSGVRTSPAQVGAGSARTPGQGDVTPVLA